MTLGETLVRLRKAKGLSQEQLAEELSLTRQTISKWELNQSAPDISYLLRLSDYFEVSTDFLLRGGQIEDDTKNIFHSSPDQEPKNDSGLSKEFSSYRWCILLGCIITGISFLGILTFIICSALNPWVAFVDGMSFDGLPGFLFGTKTLWFFIILSILFIAGFLTVLSGIIHMLRKSKK